MQNRPEGRAAVFTRCKVTRLARTTSRDLPSDGCRLGEGQNCGLEAAPTATGERLDILENVCGLLDYRAGERFFETIERKWNPFEY